MSGRKHPQKHLPAGWEPTALTREELQDYEHMLGYGVTRETALSRIGITVEAAARRWKNHNERTTAA